MKLIPTQTQTATATTSPICSKRVKQKDIFADQRLRAQWSKLTGDTRHIKARHGKDEAS